MSMNDGGREAGRRPWANMSLDLLNSIYSKLPLNDELDRRSDFGSVCRSWRQVHLDSRTPQQPLNFNFKIGADLGQRLLELDMGIPAEVRDLLYKSAIVYRFKEKGWLIVNYNHYSRFADRGSNYLSCFNPLLSWPSCFIRLPVLYNLGRDFPKEEGISASPMSQDLTIFVFHSNCLFSTIRVGQGCMWREYRIAYHLRVQVPLAIEYTEGKFVVLFDTGDVLIWEIENRGGARGRMLIANPRVFLRNPDHRENLRAVGESLVVIWRRGRSGGGKSLFRLVRVEESDDGVEVLEEGGRTTSYLIREDPNFKIINMYLEDVIIFLAVVACFGITVLIWLGDLWLGDLEGF